MDAQKGLIAEFDREAAKTRKMLDAIPADADFNFKPHPKSMSLGRLAGHLTDFSGEWALSTLTKDKIEFGPDSNWKPFMPTSKAEALEKFDKELGANARGAGGDHRRHVGPELAACVAGQGLDRRAEARGVSRFRAEPHDSPPRTVERVSAADRREGSGDVRTERGRDVRTGQGPREQGTKANAAGKLCAFVSSRADAPRERTAAHRFDT